MGIFKLPNTISNSYINCKFYNIDTAATYGNFRISQCNIHINYQLIILETAATHEINRIIEFVILIRKNILMKTIYKDIENCNVSICKEYSSVFSVVYDKRP